MNKDDIEIFIPNSENQISPLGMTKFEEGTHNVDGKKWIIHLNDLDPWPSDIHGHCYEYREVLDVYTGQIYETTNRTYKSRLSVRKLRLLYRSIKKSENDKYITKLNLFFKEKKTEEAIVWKEIK